MDIDDGKFRHEVIGHIACNDTFVFLDIQAYLVLNLSLSFFAV